LSQRCQELEEDIRRRDALKVKGKVENETIVKRFLQMAKSRNTTPNAQDWAEIISVVENFYASFALHIKSCPNISRNEYQVCVLTKLGLRVGDIAYLTGNSSSNITNIRSRMMTKIFGEEGGAKDFDARISIL
jgi:DNA-binding NarL/FixJ family response regulator